MLSYYRLVAWSVIWAVIWPVFYLFKKKDQVNCLTWAIKKWHENPEGYLVIRWSRSNRHPIMKWPHFLYLEPDNHHQLTHVVPQDRDDLEHLLPAVWFDAEQLIGDHKDQLKRND